MTKREKIYLNRKPIKREEYATIIYRKISPAAYDGEKFDINKMSDEPFSNFGMLLPTKEIKLPTKKEIKERLYGRHSKRWKQRLAISPVTCFVKATTYKEYMRSVWRVPKMTIIDNRTDKSLPLYGTK